MSDVEIYGADAADGSQQQQNVIVAQFLDEAVVKLIKAYTERKKDAQKHQNAAVAKFTDEAIAKIIQTYAEHKEREQRQFDLRGYLMVLATLTASITYTAALTPPGGFWSDDANGRAGTSVWMDKFPYRYRAFLYFNTMSFASSLCIIVMLGNKLLTQVVSKRPLFTLLVLDVIGLVGAFIVGCSTNIRISIYAIFSMALIPVMLILGLAASASRRYRGVAL